MTDRWIDWALPPPLRAGRTPDARRARVGVGVVMFVLLADIALGTSRLLTGHDAPLAVPFAVLLVALLLLLRFTGRIQVFAHGISLLLTTAVCALTLLAGGVGSVAMSAFILVPLFTAYLGGIRSAAFWALVASGCVLAFKWMQVSEMPWPVEVDPERTFPAFGTILMTFGVLAIGWAYDRARERDEEERAAQEAQLRSVLEALPDALIRLDAEGVCRQVHLGRTRSPIPEGAVGTPFLSFFADVPEVVDALERAREAPQEVEATREDGTWNLRFAPHLSGETLVLVRDATELRETQARLAEAKLQAILERADRMSSLGMLAAGMAHEINNPLAYLAGNLTYLADQIESGSEAGAALADARVAVDRIRRIVSDLKLYARQHEDDDLELVSLPAVARAAIKLAHNELQHRASIQVEHRDAQPVLGSESRLVQVVLNLLVNAAQALPPGRASEHTVTVRTFPTGDGRSAISVTDTGPGIPEKILDKVTQPFFTSKPVGVGTGLGLSVCDGIVRRLSGELRIETVVGQGTTVTALLPSSAESPTVTSLPPHPQPTARAGRILVVDDEPLVRRALRRLLRRHEVVEADSGAHAIEILTRDDAFDLILCDVMMPEVTGLDVYEILGKLSPMLQARLVFMTGGAFDEQVQDLFRSLRGVQPVIQKPFDAGELRAVLVERIGIEPPAPSPPA